MVQPVWDYSDAEWEKLPEQGKADAWGVAADALKRTLERFDPHQPAAKERWESLRSSLKEALRAREDHLKRAWGLT